MDEEDKLLYYGRLILRFSWCTNQGCPYCDIAFIKRTASIAYDKPEHLISSDLLNATWVRYHKNIDRNYDKIMSYNRRQQIEIGTQNLHLFQ